MNSFRYPVEEIKERCDLVEVISQYVALKKRGKNFTGPCPFHNEKTPGAFTVNQENQFWKCYGCGEGGDVFTFVQKIDSLTFPQAVEQLAKKAGITIERSEQASREYSERERILKANNIACTFFRNALERSERAKEYLTGRGLTAEGIERYKLGYAPEGWDGLMSHLAEQRVAIGDAVKAGLLVARESSTGFYDRFRDRLIFPIVDPSDRIIAFGGRAFGDEQPKYLNSPETPLFAKNKTLYGLNSARKVIPNEGRVIVVEGYMDVITTQSAGFGNTVATLGTALTDEHVNVLSRFTNNVVLAFDSDSAGMKAALRSAPVFEQAGFNVRILNMPKGEDPDSMLRGGDISRFAGLLERTLPIPDYRIKVALSAHDLHTDEGKAAGLKEAVDILAGVESAVDRERLIRFLAKYHANFATGTTLAEDHIRGEVERLRVRAVRRGGERGAWAGSKAPAAVVTKQQQSDVGLAERAERLLLGIILFRQADASKVFDTLSPNEFTGDNTSVLAEALSRQYSELGKIDQEDLRVRVADTPAESLLLDMLVGLDESELDESVDELIQVIVTHKKNQRRARMRDLAAKIEQGLIKHGDEDYEEYLKLVRDTSSPWRR